MAEPRYAFGDVNGVMKEGTSVSINLGESDRVSIDFTYTDQRDGQLYRVNATGYRTKIDKESTGEHKPDNY